MDNNENQIGKLINLAIENNLISIEDLTNIIDKYKNKGAVVENPIGPTVEIPKGPTVEIPQGPMVEQPMGDIVKNPLGAIVENPSEKEFDILEEERLRIERAQEEESEEYGSPGRSL